MRTPNLLKRKQAQEICETFAAEHANASIGEIAENLMVLMELPSKAMAYYWYNQVRTDNKVIVKTKESTTKRLSITEKDLSGFFPADYHRDWHKLVYGSRSSK